MTGLLNPGASAGGPFRLVPSHCVCTGEAGDVADLLVNQRRVLTLSCFKQSGGGGRDAQITSYAQEGKIILFMYISHVPWHSLSFQS